MELPEMEDKLKKLRENCSRDRADLEDLDANLLQSLGTPVYEIDEEGNPRYDKKTPDEQPLPLIENIPLIETLEVTKKTSGEVKENLKQAGLQETEINDRRQAFTPVATRGALMYFCMVDMTNITMPPPLDAIKTGWMYNCSLGQFLIQFDYSVNWSDGGRLSMEQKLSKKKQQCRQTRGNHC
jgi:dynein heavy chain